MLVVVARILVLVALLGAIGAMDHWIARTIQYAKERKAFGRPLTGFQVTRHKFADLCTTLHAARSLTYDALRRFEAGESPVQEVTMAKHSVHSDRSMSSPAATAQTR